MATTRNPATTEKVAPVTFCNVRFDGKVYLHPDRKPRSVVDSKTGMVHTIQEEPHRAKFEPVNGPGMGGYYTTDDPGMIAYLREKTKTDKNLVEVLPGKPVQPARKPVQRIPRALVPAGGDISW